MNKYTITEQINGFMSATSDWDSIEEITEVIEDILIQNEAKGNIGKEINIKIKINY